MKHEVPFAKWLKFWFLFNSKSYAFLEVQSVLQKNKKFENFKDISITYVIFLIALLNAITCISQDIYIQHHSKDVYKEIKIINVYIMIKSKYTLKVYVPTIKCSHRSTIIYIQNNASTCEPQGSGQSF